MDLGTLQPPRTSWEMDLGIPCAPKDPLLDGFGSPQPPRTLKALQTSWVMGLETPYPPKTP